MINIDARLKFCFETVKIEYKRIFIVKKKDKG
jgi:hypothetical protein